jgi:hypothetical protein
MLHESPVASTQLEQQLPSANIDRHLGNLYPEAIVWKKAHGEAVAKITAALLTNEIGDESNSGDTSLPKLFRDELAEAAGKIVFAAKHHDIGILNLGSDVTQDEANAMINKKTKPTPEEWEILKRHPVQGALLLEAQGVTDPLVLAMVAIHHRFQDDIYPSNDDENLKRILSRVPANKVALVIHGASLIALADTVRAICEKRPYDDSRGLNEAYGELCTEGRWSNNQIGAAVRACKETFSQVQPESA